MSIEPDSFLVYLLLIITGITLFLCILNMITLHELTRKLKKAWGPSKKGPEEQEAVRRRVSPSTVTKTEAAISAGEGIDADISRLVEQYGLDSLILAGPEGLAIGASGSIDPEFEAAYYTDLHSRNAQVPDQQVRLIEVSYDGIPVIGIARRRNAGKRLDEDRIRTDIHAVLEKYLAATGEAI